jgi:ribosomal-protein-alanine N-acetyltransferase
VDHGIKWRTCRNQYITICPADDINTESDAEIWLTKMLSESYLLTVKCKSSDSVIGFVFLYESDNSTAHLGYMLAGNSWPQGYGSELLFGLLESCRNHKL